MTLVTPGASRCAIVSSFSTGTILSFFWRHLITENSLPLPAIFDGSFCSISWFHSGGSWNFSGLFCLGSSPPKITQLLGFGSHLTLRKSTRFLFYILDVQSIPQIILVLALWHCQSLVFGPSLAGVKSPACM